MSPLLKRFGKLRGRSLAELRARCAQAAQVRLERLGVSPDAREPSDRAFARVFDCEGLDRTLGLGDALLRRFREQHRPLGDVFPTLGTPAATTRVLRARLPRCAAAAVAAADQIMEGRVHLGGRVSSIDAHPDWTYEPMCAKRAPAIHWSKVAYLDPLVAGDSKFTWELNRHQYFVTLGRAYALTNDDRYAARIAEHLLTWMDDNPPNIGINWTSSLELAFRAISWIWAFHLVRNSPAFQGDVFGRALKSLYLHARHIERNLSTYFSPNTHLTGEALGLLYIGTAFPEFRRASHWRALGRRILVEQLDRQLFGDGVYFEQSTYYHRYTADFYLHALLFSRAAGQEVYLSLRSKLDGLLDYLVSITRPDGTSPLIGDDDGGRLLVLGGRASNDFRDTLAIGAALLRRADCAYVAGDSVEELLWLLGPEGLQVYESLKPTAPAQTSRGFADSGYFVMRDSWRRTADWAIVRCGPHAPNTGAHAHADALAMELSIGGCPILVDSGTYLYTASREQRDYFRGSAAHNTVVVDELSSAEPAASAFKWKSVAHSRVTSWVRDAAFDFFEGEHDGYCRLEAPALHSRAVFFLKGEYWVIRDRVRSVGSHRIALYLHWAPGIVLSPEAPDTVCVSIDDAQRPHTSMRVFARTGELSHERNWVSTAFGTRTSAPVSVFRLDGEGTENIVTLFTCPTTSLRPEQCAWREVAGGACGVLTIDTGSARDTIITGPSTDAGEDCDGILSDASWTWVRRSPGGRPLAFAAANGRRLSIDDTIIPNSRLERLTCTFSG